MEAFSWVKEELNGCLDPREVAMHVQYDEIWNGHVQLKKKGVRMRVVTEITSDNITHVKKVMKIWEVRHLAGVRSNFGIADRKECLLHSISRDEQPLSHAIISNAKALVEAQQYLFETLWNKAIPAEEKIREIEEGVVPDFINTISDPIEIQRLTSGIITSATEKIDVVFSTANTFKRYEGEGIIDVLVRKANFGINIRILIEHDHSTQDKVKKLVNTCPTINVHYLNKAVQTKVTTFLADNALSLVVELKDDTKLNSNEAIGLATYSNSESTVLSYVSIFETLWLSAQQFEEV